MNTLAGDRFEKFTTTAEKEREKYIVMNKQLNVECVLEKAKIIAESNSFSSIAISFNFKL